MRNSHTIIAAAIGILSLASLASVPAQAGSSSGGAPSKYNNQFSHQTGPTVARSAVAITEFSSSSAPIRSRAPKR